MILKSPPLQSTKILACNRLILQMFSCGSAQMSLQFSQSSNQLLQTRLNPVSSVLSNRLQLKRASATDCTSRDMKANLSLSINKINSNCHRLRLIWNKPKVRQRMLGRQLFGKMPKKIRFLHNRRSLWRKLTHITWYISWPSLRRASIRS